MTDMWERYYEERAANVVASLQKKNINAWYLPNRKEALSTVMGMIPPGARVACGDSMTLEEVGVIKEVRRRGQNELTNPLERDAKGQYLIADRVERADVQRQAFTADVFLSGTNAITLDGKLVNIDGMGSRVSAMIFGPRKVIIVVGANKIVTGEAEAVARIHDIAAPLNATRHVVEHGRTEYADLPCVRTGSCPDCSNDWRICRITVIIDGVSPRDKGRINVVLVGEKLGL